jgi:hypothetical protein
VANERIPYSIGDDTVEDAALKATRWWTPTSAVEATPDGISDEERRSSGTMSLVEGRAV